LISIKHYNGQRNGFGFDLNTWLGKTASTGDQKIDKHIKEETRKLSRCKTLDITNLTKSKPTQ